MLRSSSKRWCRDATLLLLLKRYPLTLQEAISLRWEHVDIAGKVLHVYRGRESQYARWPLGKLEYKALTRLRKQSGMDSIWVFETKQHEPLSYDAVTKLLWRAYNGYLLVKLPQKEDGETED